MVEVGGKVDTVLITTGYDCWKKALEKDRGFRKHNDSQSHANAEKSYRSYLQVKSVDTQLSEERDREISRRQHTVQRNRRTLQRIFGVVRFLSRLSLPFRGHDESPQSLNRGVFLDLINHLAENGDNILVDHLSKASANATYLRPTSQNEIIAIVGEEIQREVTRRASTASMFAVMMDETTDVSRKEQVSIFVRYVNESSSVDCKLEERWLALIDTAETTGGTAYRGAGKTQLECK